jgi:YkoY family integral membrane protein
MWGIHAADVPTILVAVATLVLLEGLLSADNALVLAVMVRHLPKRQQRRALRFGIWGAFAFRLIAVIFASLLLRFWQLKALGGLYLLFLAVRHFALGEHQHEGELTPDTVQAALAASGNDVLAGDEPPEGKPRKGPGFWATVVNVEVADIAFSIDSILAAVAMADSLPPNLQAHPYGKLAIIYAGGVLGIIAMRMVAGFFLILLERFKGLAIGAYVLVAWIGLNLVSSGLKDAFDPKKHDLNKGWYAWLPRGVKEFPWDIPDWIFWAVMGLIVVASLFYRPSPQGPGRGEEPPGRETSSSPNGSAPEGELHTADQGAPEAT